MEEPSPTEAVKRDHRVIERALNGIEAIADDIARTGSVPVETLAGLVVFSQTFIGRCHDNEEVCLFPCLERRGVQKERGPMGVMFHERQVERGLVVRIGEELSTPRVARADTRKLSRLLTEYVALLRGHIAKEEVMLFQMGDRLMRYDDREDFSGMP